jgi:hypothetical protein
MATLSVNPKSIILLLSSLSTMAADYTKIPPAMVAARQARVCVGDHRHDWRVRAPPDARELGGERPDVPPGIA